MPNHFKLGDVSLTPSSDNCISNQSVDPVDNPWIERLGWILVLLACALSISPNVADPDLWGHVQYGRDVISDRAIPATTSYSFTAEGFRWVNHENLSEIVMATVADSLGPLGLIVGKLLLGMAIIGAMIYVNCRNGIAMIPNAMLALLVASNLGYHWSIRPQLASFACFTVLLILLHFSFAGWRDNWHLRFPRHWFERSRNDHPNELGYDSFRLRCLWLVVPLFFIWGNSHGGFAAGLCILTLYLGGRMVEAINRRGRDGWVLVRRMALMMTVALLATFVNPYGPHLQFWLVESVGRPRPEILDWKNFQLLTLVGFKFWLMLGVVAFALTFSKRRHDATQWLVMAIVLWQSITHFRHVPFFVLMCGFWIGPHLGSALQIFTNRSHQRQLSPLLQRIAVTGLILTICGVGFRVVQRASDLRVERDQYPVSAVQFMHDHNIRGRMVVTYNWAQYAIAAFCVGDPHRVDPQSNQRVSQVSFDGRFRTAFPQSIIVAHFDFLYGDRPIARFRDARSGEIDPGRILELSDPEIVLLARFGEYSEQNMQAFTDRWVLLYQDSIAQVWGIKHRFDHPENPDYIPLALRSISDQKQTGSMTWPALPSSRQPSSTTRLVEHVRSN